MKFFSRATAEIISKFVHNTIKGAGKSASKSGGMRTTCGKIVDPDGDISMWGIPGSAGVRIVKHDVDSQIQAQKDADKIRQAGGVPQVEITWFCDSSRYASEGFMVHNYIWSAKDIRTEIQEAVNNGPHV